MLLQGYRMSPSNSILHWTTLKVFKLSFAHIILMQSTIKSGSNLVIPPLSFMISLDLGCSVFHHLHYQRWMTHLLKLALTGSLKTVQLESWKANHGLGKRSLQEPMARSKFLPFCLHPHLALFFLTLPILREPLSPLHYG